LFIDEVSFLADESEDADYLVLRELLHRLLADDVLDEEAGDD
jgi:hypothetical protein